MPDLSRVDTRLDLIATVLLALATVATAWSGYQASRWNAEQAKSAGRTTGIRIQAARAQSLAQAEEQVDVATFSSWADAYARGETTLANFYFKRFRVEFKPAVEAWIATRPLKNPNAPLTPFAMPEYKLKAQAEADALDAQSAWSAADVLRYIQRSTNYVLAAVLFATTLFFAGISTKLPSPGLRRALLAVGVIVFVATAAWLASSPVSISV
jgi:hypothetical protein